MRSDSVGPNEMPDHVDDVVIALDDVRSLISVSREEKTEAAAKLLHTYPGVDLIELLTRVRSAGQAMDLCGSDIQPNRRISYFFKVILQQQDRRSSSPPPPTRSSGRMNAAAPFDPEAFAAHETDQQHRLANEMIAADLVRARRKAEFDAWRVPFVASGKHRPAFPDKPDFTPRKRNDPGITVRTVIGRPSFAPLVPRLPMRGEINDACTPDETSILDAEFIEGVAE